MSLTGADAAERALEEAFGRPVARMGSGGSIPLVARLRETYPDAAFVIWGAQDSDQAQIHAANESVDLGELGEDGAGRGAAARAARLIPPARGDGRAGENGSASAAGTRGGRVRRFTAPPRVAARAGRHRCHTIRQRRLARGAASRRSSSAAGVGLDGQHRALLGAQEAAIDGVVEEREQRRRSSR